MFIKVKNIYILVQKLLKKMPDADKMRELGAGNLKYSTAMCS